MKEKYLYLPEISTGHQKTSDESNKDSEPRGNYPCPCCGYLTLPVPENEAIAYICPVCFWENDVFITADDEPSDENHGLTLKEAREHYKSFGAVEKRLLPYVRKPKKEEYPRS